MPNFVERSDGLVYHAWSFRLANGENITYDTFSGLLSSRVNYKNGKKHGLWESYDVQAYSGSISSDLIYKGNYVNGVKDGFWEERESGFGNNLSKGTYKMGIKEDVWEYYKSTKAYNKNHELRF